MRLAGLQNTNVNPTGVMPDVLAIAPYFGTFFTPANIPPNAPYPTVDYVLTNLAVPVHQRPADPDRRARGHRRAAGLDNRVL